MNSMVSAARATCSQGILIYILMSTGAVLLFLPVIFLLLPPLCFLLPLLLFVLQEGVLYPVILHSFFLIHQLVIVIVPEVLEFLYLFRSYLTRFPNFRSADLRSQGAFH